MKKKVLILNSGSLPVPATLGGAVETGIEQLIEVNDIKDDVELYILSVYNEKAIKIARNYKKLRYYIVRYSNLDLKKQLFKKVINKVYRMIGIQKQYNINDRFLNEAIKLINKEKIEYVIVKNSASFLSRIKSETNCKIIFQLHNDFLNNKTYHAKKLSDIVDFILVNSNYIRNRVMTISECLDKKIGINKNCLDMSEYANVDNSKINSIANKYKINLEKKNILFSGRLHPSKGCYEMLLALEKIKDRNDWHCIIAGGKWFSDNRENSYIKKLKETASKMPNKITFLGYVPHSEIPTLNIIANMVVVPSIWEEPAGRVVLEAQAGGAVPIVSDSGGISDYLIPDSGVVVNRGKYFVEGLSDAIKNLLDDEKRLLEMSKVGRSFVQDFNEERYYDELIGFIDKIGDSYN